MTTAWAVEWAFRIGVSTLVFWLMSYWTRKKYREEVAALKKALENSVHEAESQRSRATIWKSQAEQLSRELEGERLRSNQNRAYGNWDSAANYQAFAEQLRRAQEAMNRQNEANERFKRFQEAARRQSKPAAATWATVLGIPATSTPDQIKARYRELAQKYHPDKPGGDEEQFKKLGHWYKIALKERAGA